MNVEIPANTRATIYIPSADVKSITESGKAVSSIKEIKVSGKEGNYTKLETGSGSYKFEFKN